MPRRLPSGRWQGIVRIPGAGVDRRRTKVFDLRRKARAWEDEQRAALARGEWRDPKLARILFEDWCARWLSSRNVEPETAAADRLRLDRHVLPKWSGMPLGAIGRLEVQSWVTAMGKAGVGRPTILKAYTLFAGCMTAAVDEDLIGRSPCRTINLGEKPAPRLRYWQPEQVDWILGQLPQPYATFAAMMCWCGLRWEEAVALPVDAVNWLRREITVVQVVTSARRIKLYAKSQAGHRTVKMFGPVAELLQPAWETAVAQRGDDGLLWVAPAYERDQTGRLRRDRDGRLIAAGVQPLLNRTWGAAWRARIRLYHVAQRRDAPEPGRPWAVLRGYNSAAVEWHRTKEQAVRDARARRAGVTGVPYYSPHTLRHTGASWLAQAGVSMQDIQYWLGHEREDSTKIYAHLSPERSNATIGEALAKLGQSVAQVDRKDGSG